MSETILLRLKIGCASLFSQADRIIAEFLNDPNNADLKAYIKQAAIGAGVSIIVGTILEDIITAGVGVADDWPSFVLAHRINRFGVKRLDILWS